MAEYRRYQPRRNNPQGWSVGRWLLIGGVIIVVIIIGRMFWGGQKDSTDNTNIASNENTAIRLLTDNANLNTNTTATANTNATVNTNTVVAAAAGTWDNFSVTSCPNAISNFGTTKRAVLTIGFSAANDSVTQALNSLKQSAVPADFFVSGSFATKNPAVVKSATDAGFAVYSQSFDSTDLTQLSEAEVKDAIAKTETAIIDATDVSPKPIIRPPAGSYTATTLKILKQAGYCAVLWTVDAYDWQDGITVDLSKERVMIALEKNSGGSIIALHAGYDITPQLITDLVAELKSKGYEIVTLATLLNS